MPSPRPAVHFWGDYSAHSFAWFEGMSHGVVSQSQLRLQFHARKTATPRQFLREISIACCSRRLEEANLDFVSIKDFYVFAQPISMCLRRRVMRRHHKEKGAKGALSLRRDETGIFFSFRTRESQQTAFRAERTRTFPRNLIIYCLLMAFLSFSLRIKSLNWILKNGKMRFAMNFFGDRASCSLSSNGNLNSSVLVLIWIYVPKMFPQSIVDMKIRSKRP